MEAAALYAMRSSMCEVPFHRPWITGAAANRSRLAAMAKDRVRPAAHMGWHGRAL